MLFYRFTFRERMCALRVLCIRTSLSYKNLIYWLMELNLKDDLIKSLKFKEQILYRVRKIDGCVNSPIHNNILLFFELLLFEFFEWVTKYYWFTVNNTLINITLTLSIFHPIQTNLRISSSPPFILMIFCWSWLYTIWVTIIATRDSNIGNACKLLHNWL